MKVPSRVTNAELLGQYMEDAAKEFGPTTPYGEQPIRAPFKRSEVDMATISQWFTASGPQKPMLGRF